MITLTLPIVNWLSSISREGGLTEIDWLWKELLQGKMCALYVSVLFKLDYPYKLVMFMSPSPIALKNTSLIYLNYIY
ncbi:hypothetical protein [Bacillus sp. AFS014408]|uniref:hypothetical protein n=1 Tax=Bacillus sp. AFS014408 TaxID=2034278 RepID=UPI001596ADEE|nr:hypothetical protein [Bacillus sp. AFS014408]